MEDLEGVRVLESVDNRLENAKLPYCVSSYPAYVRSTRNPRNAIKALSDTRKCNA
jgi:hypothetical protein